MSIADAAISFSQAMAYLMKMKLAAHDAPKHIYAEIYDADAIEEAKNQAKIALDNIYAWGHEHMIAAQMEAIEAMSWHFSMNSDYQKHEAECLELFQEIFNHELPEADEEEADELIEEKSFLESCLAASAG